MSYHVARMLVFGAGLVMAASTASAANIYATAYNSATNQFDSQYAFGGSVSALSSGAGAAGFARTKFGVNKSAAATSSTVVAGLPYSSPTASAESGWSDDLILTSSSGSGFISIALDLSYALSTELDGGYDTSLGLSYQFFTAGPGAEYYYLTIGPEGGGADMSGGASEIVQIFGGGSVRRLITLDIPFLSGEVISLTSKLVCSAGAAANGPEGSSAFSTCSADHSSYWAGVIGVTDADGKAIAGWSLSSASGTDYRNSFVSSGVPEPASWALTILGFGAVGAAMRQKRHTSARGGALRPYSTRVSSRTSCAWLPTSAFSNRLRKWTRAVA